MINELWEMYKTFQLHFAELFTGSSGPESKKDLTGFQIEIPCYSGRVIEYCEGPTTHVEVIEAMVDYAAGKPPELGYLP